MRDSVIALTDEDGYIVENYSYGDTLNVFSKDISEKIYRLNLLLRPIWEYITKLSYLCNPKLFIGRLLVVMISCMIIKRSSTICMQGIMTPEAGRFIIEKIRCQPISQNLLVQKSNLP